MAFCLGTFLPPSPPHLICNQMNAKITLLMPLSYDPGLLVLPMHQKFPARRETHPEHDAIAVFVHFISIWSNLPICIHLARMTRALAKEHTSCWEQWSSLPTSIWAVALRPAHELQYSNTKFWSDKNRNTDCSPSRPASLGLGYTLDWGGKKKSFIDCHWEKKWF